MTMASSFMSTRPLVATLTFVCLIASSACSSGGGGGGSAGSGGAAQTSISVSGTADGVPLTAVDVAAQKGSECGGKALVVATSGATITCGPSLTEAVGKPYIILSLSDSAPGTYTAASDLPGSGPCPSKIFRGSVGAEGISTLDALGSVVIDASDGEAVHGSFDLLWAQDGQSGHGSAQGTFSARICP